MLIGISNPELERLDDEAFLLRFGVSEWDSGKILELNSRRRSQLARLLARCGHSLILSTPLGRDADAERLRVLLEVLGELGGMALMLRPRKTVLEDPQLLFGLVRELSAPPLAARILIEPGREHVPPEGPRQAHPGIDWVADPLWHPRPSWSRARVLKCHGWHEARWIRYYGPEQLETIRRRSKNAEILLWGHSKREEEALRFCGLKSSGLKSSGQ